MVRHSARDVRASARGVLESLEGTTPWRSGRRRRVAGTLFKPYVITLLELERLPAQKPLHQCSPHIPLRVAALS